MIRYEVDDIIEIGGSLPGYPGYGTVKSILGKVTNWFNYEDTRVHPTAFSDILESVSEVEEFQIIQTRQGAHIKIVADGEPDIAGIKNTIVENLEKYGLTRTEVTIETVISASPPRNGEDQAVHTTCLSWCVSVVRSAGTD